MNSGDLPAPVAVLDRLSIILDAFKGSGRLTLSQVTRRTGLPRSSVHRMLEQLVSKRWLSRIGHEYELGLGIVELGSTAIEQNRLHTRAMPLLNEIHRVSGMVVHLGVLDQIDVIYLGKVGEPSTSAAIPTRIGGRHPAHQTALGRALLAFTKHRIPENSWPLPMQTTLRQVRDSGIAHESGSMVAGLNCIAVPIGPIHRAIGALSICGPAARLRLDHRSAVPLFIAAATIWESVGLGNGRSHDLRQGVRTLRSMPTAPSGWSPTRPIRALAQR
ncbi:IclR family transcriptional regulator [Rhodococcus qingshengii]|uniref:IclR family transcriptional regulator n=1 Tax=Rhodococcus qingshengii TaxID=334542 RepID=UPI0035E0FB95